MFWLTVFTVGGGEWGYVGPPRWCDIDRTLQTTVYLINLSLEAYQQHTVCVRARVFYVREINLQIYGYRLFITVRVRACVCVLAPSALVCLLCCIKDVTFPKLSLPPHCFLFASCSTNTHTALWEVFTHILFNVP